VLEQLREWGIDISAGQVDALLTGKHEPFHKQKLRNRGKPQK
jgi:hypothetical protein